MRKIIGSRFETLTYTLQEKDLFPIYDILHDLVKKIDEFDIHSSGKFSLRMRIRIIFLQLKEYKSLSCIEKYPWNTRFLDLLSSKESFIKARDPLLRLYLREIRKLQSNPNSSGRANNTKEIQQKVPSTTSSISNKKLMGRTFMPIKSFLKIEKNSWRKNSLALQIHLLTLLCITFNWTLSLGATPSLQRSRVQNFLNNSFKRVIQATHLNLKSSNNDDALNIAEPLVRLFGKYLREKGRDSSEHISRQHKKQSTGSCNHNN